MVNREFLEKISGCLERLDSASIIKSPEAQELISKIGSSRLDELSDESRLSAQLLYGFAKYQDIVCDLVNLISALKDEESQDRIGEAVSLVNQYQAQMKSLDAKYDNELKLDMALKMCPVQTSPQVLLEQTSDQWNELVAQINSIVEAIHRKDDVSDYASAMVWQASLFPKTIALKGEAAKFANRFNELIANINVDNTDSAPLRSLS